MPYDPEQVARQRAEQRASERESGARQKAAGTSPLQSSGGKGWVSDAGSGSDKAADSPGKYDGGAAKPSKALTAQDSGGAVDTGGPAKSYGIDSGDQDPMGYLGHFGRDDVASRGHNKGHKKLGKTPLVKTVAPKGFRKLPGSASPQQGHARYGTMSEAELGLRPNRAQRQQDAKMKAAMTRTSKQVMLQDPFPLRSAGSSPGAVNKAGGSMPPTVPNKKMSIKHEKDRIAFNMKHARDHTRDAQEARRKLNQIKKIKPPKA
jgi:hypothetical protein